MIALPILSPQESGAWDGAAERDGIPLITLMECAGRATATVLGLRYGGRLGAGVLVAAGPGNNGGDGWVVARVLHRQGVPVWVAALPGTPSQLNSEVRSRAEAEGVRTLEGDGPWPGVGLCLDAILGTGAKGAPREAAQRLLDRMHELDVPVAAIDGPSGVDLANGAVYGNASADLSITFGGFRRGHALARDQVGEVVVVDIGHPPPDPAWPRVMTDAMAAAWLPAFPARAHKGTRGRVVALGGQAGMSGALRLSTRAAFSAGAGLVHGVAPAETIATLTQAEPDLQTAVQDFAGPLAPAVVELLGKADAVVVGPGLGRDDSRATLVLAVLEAATRAVVDADGLIALVGRLDEVRRLGESRRLILTPHPGEFRTLFPDVPDLEVDPWAAAQSAAQATGAVVILKGVPSVVAAPDAAPMTVMAGNPGLATGGSGDVLSGLAGAFLAQGLEPFAATALAAQALGRSADLAAPRRGARTLRPMDVVHGLADVWQAWSRAGQAPAEPAPVLYTLPRPHNV